MSAQLTIDFRAVSHTKYFYRNQFGETLRIKPTVPTVHGVPFNPDEMIQGETRLQRAQRIGVLDRWTPVCVLQLRNNHSLRFEGEKAKQKWKAYNRHIYGN